MNKTLRKEIYKMRMLHNKFLKNRSKVNWENYRKQRNHVNKVKKKSIQNYFFERCVGGPKSSDFWPTIKPFLSKKGSSSNNHITLSENGEIINDPAKVSEVFNDFFINVAKNIGNTNVIVNKEHPSVCMIKENKLITDDLNFKPVSSNFVSKQINKLNIKKATGYDGISPKILKLSMPCIVEPITFFY